MRIKKKKTSDEKTIQDAVIQYLSLKKYFFWRNNTGALRTEHGGFIRFGAVGSPDICLVKDGKFIGLEIKDKAPQSDGQKIFEQRLREAGGDYYIIRSVDQVMAIL